MGDEAEDLRPKESSVTLGHNLVKMDFGCCWRLDKEKAFLRSTSTLYLFRVFCIISISACHRRLTSVRIVITDIEDETG